MRREEQAPSITGTWRALCSPNSVISLTLTPPPRQVHCYHCRQAISVPGKAITLTCPLCYRAIHVCDIVIERERFAGAVRTCGLLVVGNRGRLKAESVIASQGIQVLGELQGHVTCGGPVVIGPEAVWNGDCTAANIIIRPGATILGGRFTITGAIPSHV